MTIYIEATFDTSGKLLNASSLLPFITSMLCLTLATNVLTTCASDIRRSVPGYLTLSSSAHRPSNLEHSETFATSLSRCHKFTTHARARRAC